MKKLVFFILLLTVIKSASAQSQVRPTMYGITDEAVSITQLQDSVKNAGDMNFIQLGLGMLAQSYTIVYTPKSGAPYLENARGRSISPEIKYRIKNAKRGDMISIGNVKTVFEHRDVVLTNGRTYLLR
jgi:hypothetical protein